MQYEKDPYDRQISDLKSELRQMENEQARTVERRKRLSEEYEKLENDKRQLIMSKENYEGELNNLNLKKEKSK